MDRYLNAILISSTLAYNIITSNRIPLILSEHFYFQINTSHNKLHTSLFANELFTFSNRIYILENKLGSTKDQIGIL